MDKLRIDLTELLPEGIFLMDMKEDPHKGLVRCYVDSEMIISLSDTTSIAKRIRESGLLDEYYPNGASLEVSTLGISEPLTLPFQFRKNVGRFSNLMYSKNGYKKQTDAELVGFDEETLFLKNKQRGQFQLKLESVYQAKVIVQFN